jgi:hypothetical protein
VILNGIEEVVNRPDLADRAIFLTLEPIPDDKRRLEGNCGRHSRPIDRASWARCSTPW